MRDLIVASSRANRFMKDSSFFFDVFIFIIHYFCLPFLFLNLRKHGTGGLLSRLKTRKVLGVGETENGDVHRSKVSRGYVNNLKFYKFQESGKSL